LPATLAGGAPWPQRNLIIFLTFSAILVTLVLQGLTLPALIRALGLAGSSAPDGEAQQARRMVIESALAYLEEARLRDRADLRPLYDDLERHYRDQLANFAAQPSDGSMDESTERYQRYLQISRDVIGVQRRRAIELHRGRRINDEVLQEILRHLDFNELRLGAVDLE
jgi:CPA1 family monovalent cation:H+ antiporter